MMGYQLITFFFYAGWLEALIAITFSVALFLAILMIHQRFKHDQQKKRQHKLKMRWNQVLPTVLKGEETYSALWQMVPKQQELYFVDFLYSQACLPLTNKLNHSQQTLTQLAEPYINSVINQLQQHNHPHTPDPELQARLIAILGKLSPETSLDILLKSLNHPAKPVAFAALRALVNHPNPNCAAHIAKVLTRFQNYRPEYIASLLAQMQPASGIPALVKIALNAESPLWTRIVSLCAIEHWPAYPEYIPDLQLIGQDEQQASALRALILRVLASWQANPAANHLIYNFAASDDAILRAHAMYAIGKLNLHSEHELLELGLHDPARWVAIEAASSSEYLHAEGNKNRQPLRYLQSVELTA